MKLPCKQDQPVGQDNGRTSYQNHGKTKPTSIYVLDGKARAVPGTGQCRDNKGVRQYDVSKLCTVLAKEVEWADKLNSMARQASTERGWSAIKGF